MFQPHFCCDFQLCHFHSGPVCSSKQKWHSLPLVLFAQLRPSTTAPIFFKQLCNSTTCAYEGCASVCVYEIKHSANTFLLLLSCSHASLSCVCLPLVLLPWVVGVQLSAEINGGLVLLALEADSLLYSVIALFHTCLLLAFCMCTSVCLPWSLYTFGPCPCLRERLDLKGKTEACRLDYYVLFWLSLPNKCWGERKEMDRHAGEGGHLKCKVDSNQTQS